MNLQKQAEELMGEEKDLSKYNDNERLYAVGCNDTIRQCRKQIPTILQMIKKVADEKMLAFFAKYSIDRPIPPSEIRKEWEEIISLFNEN